MTVITRRLAVLALMSLAVCASTSWAATSSVGATAGSFAVSSSGSATYTIPITVPPGLSGMQPNISLSYDSQAGNGLLGVGWNIAGLSVIHRCGATIDRDGFKGGVNLDGSDRYCLDGQRLIVVNNGANGGDLSEYRTERETFAKVISYGSQGSSGPQGWRVWTKSGHILEYGKLTDETLIAAPESRVAVLPSSSTVIAWPVNVIKDTVGNYLRVYYAINASTSPASVEYYPTLIDYTGNTATGMAPSRSVQFQYEARADTATAYVGGVAMNTTQRLTHVYTYSGVTSVRDYRIAYETLPSAATGRSRLTSLQECTGDGTTCLSPSTVTWQNSSIANAELLSGVLDPGVSGNRWWADVNGDGRADYCRVVGSSSPGYQVSCRVTNGLDVLSGIIDPGYSDSRWWADINGDGRQDFCREVGSTGAYQISCRVATETGFASDIVSGVLDPGVSGSRWLVDINGDGRSDYCRIVGSDAAGYQISCRISIGSAFVSSDIFSGVIDPGFSGSRWWADVNGDSRQDYCREVGSAGAYQVTCKLSTGSGFGGEVGTGVIDPGFADSRWWADINGDGRQDYCREVGSTGAYQVTCKLSTGSGFGAEVSTGVIDPGFSGSRWWADINGDGRQDYCRLVGSDAAGYQISCQPSNGASFGPNVLSAVLDQGYSDSRWFTDFNGNGYSDYCRLVGSSTAYQTVCRQIMIQGGDLLVTLANGLSAQITNITYKPITDNTVYSKETSASHPVMDYQGPMYVVASYQATNGTGGLNTTSYSYTGAKVHQTGRGFLGFHTIAQTAPTGIKTTTIYGQTTCSISATTVNMACIGLPLRTDASLGATTLSTTITEWDTVGNFPYAKTITQSSWDTDITHTAFPTVTTTNQPPDAYGNILQTNVSTSDGYTTQTVNTYLGADSANWFIGRLSSSRVTKSVPDTTVSPVTRTSCFQYYANGLLQTEVIEPNAINPCTVTPFGAYTLATSYTYDSYGHRNSTTVSGPDITTRTSRSDYVTSPGAASVQITNTNAKGHTETQTIDARFGVVSSLTGPNGLITNWGYDGFGRQISESRADGTSTTTAFYACPGATCPSGTPPSNAKYAVTTTLSGATPVTVFYDMLARAVQRTKLGFNSATIYQDTTYDNLGYVRTASRPYYSGGAVYNDTTYFDVLGRPSSVLAANGLSTTYGYAGLTSTVTLSHSTLPGIETTTQVKNGVGGLMTVTDAQGRVTSYKYDPFGNLLKTTDPNGNVVTMTYDVRGRKRTMNDPDMGNWTYGYNVLGEITSQVDGKGQSSSMHYDVLGRMDSRTENEGTSTWIYDNATGKGIGKLASVSGPGGYARTYVYDTLSRPVRVSTTIAGTTFLVDTGYDGYSRVSSVQYPNTGSSRYTVYSCYDSNGYLNVVTTASSCVSPATWYWKATFMDSLGNVTTESLGNGLTTMRSYNPTNGLVSNINTNSGIQNIDYTFNALGNLTGRNDTVNGVNETFQYDTLNRLTAVTGPANKSYAYDALGNITNKSDFGDTYIYGEASAQPAGPHAVTTVKKVGVIVASYRYDANGNMTSGPGRTVTYTSFNLPSQVTQGSVINTFTYSAEHERTVETSSNGDITVQLSPRWDSGVHFEKVTHTSAPTEYLHYIYAGSTPVAIYTVKSDGTNNTKYLHKDQLGSIAATTNASGVLIERMSYDAFGKRRLENGLDGSVTISSTHHGFTGHEMMDEVGLINMNGRQYDPTLGRFIESDPSIQGAVNLQSFNRYSYVLENPLSLVDPSGYNWASKLWHKHVNKLVFGIVPNTPFVKEEFRRSYILRTIGSITAATYGPWGTAVYSAYLSRVVYGSSWTDAASSAAISGGTSYLNMKLNSTNPGSAMDYISRPVYAGSVGGAASAIRGGNFEQGFLRSALMQGVTEANFAMRLEMLKQCAGNPNNCNGESGGFFGISTKLAGARRDQLDPTGALGIPCVSAAGGCQGAYNLAAGDDAPNLVGINYSPRSIGDYVSESFSGPHDWLRNATGSYDALGNSVHLDSFLASAWDSTKNWGLVAVAAPFSVSAIMMTGGMPGAGY